MSKAIPVRQWATPLTISAFFLMSATGVLMFFEIDQGLMTVVHQWFSWIFLAGAGGHIVANLRPFKNHLKSRWGLAASAVCIALMIASISNWGIITGPQLERPLEEALVDAPLTVLANLAQTAPDVVLGRLVAKGIVATGPQSVRDITIASGVGENRLLAIIFDLD
jgi:hypothetical protein